MSESEKPPQLFAGDAGKTRIEHVHFSHEDEVRSVAVHVVVNVATDPDLRELALSGALHRFDGGVELAIPFVYHDPAARKFALVLPPSLRHAELRERGKLFERLAENAEHAIPPYVREGRVVIGAAGLSSYVAQLPAAPAAPKLTGEEIARREADLREQNDRISTREARLQQRAEDVTLQEDELRTLEEELEARAREVELREQELATRLRALDERAAEVLAREEAVTKRERDAEHRTGTQRLPEERLRSVPPPPPPAARRPPSAPPPPPPSASSPSAIPPSGVSPIPSLSRIPRIADQVVESLHDDVDDVRAEDLEDIEPSGTNPERVASSIEEAVEALEDDGDVVDVEDGEITGIGPEPLRGERTVMSEPPPAAAAAPARVSVAPSPFATPEAFLADRDAEMAAGLGESGVRLFVRLPGEQREAFRGGSNDLLIQLANVQGYPIAVLALVDGAGARPLVRRAPLDPANEEHRRILDALAERFTAEVALFTGDGRYERSFTLSADRSENVQALLRRAPATAPATEIDAATALERVLAVPPPVRDAAHPFGEPTLATDTPKDVVAAVHRLADWVSPEKLERAELLASVPVPRVRGTVRRVLERACALGVPLTPGLASRAVELGIVPDVTTLVARGIEAFAGTVEGADHGFSAVQVAELWDQHLVAASEHRVEVPRATETRAWKAIRLARGDTGARLADLDVAKVGSLDKVDLLAVLDHPVVREAAIRELARRADADTLETLFNAVRKLPRDELASVLPDLVRLGESAGDAWIDGLSAKKPHVRHASILVLGHMKLRRAIAPLLHALENEETELWEEVARILGRFGGAGLKALKRSLKEPKAPRERYTRALAHLALGGAHKQVDELGDDPDAGLRSLGRDALTQRDAAKERNERASGGGAREAADAVGSFARSFHDAVSAAAGTAPAEELPEPGGSS